MQSFQVMEQIETLRQELQVVNNNGFMDFLAVLKSCKNALNKPMMNTIETEGDINTIVGRLNTYKKVIKESQTDIRKIIKPNIIFKSIEKLQKAFNVLSESEEFNQQESYLNNIDSQFLEFQDAYEQFINDYSYFSTVELVNSGTDILHSIKSTEDIATLILRNLQNRYEYDNSLDSLSLLLDSDYTYKDFVTKLEALQKLYSQLCFLLHISESDFPLRIAKIESGSLFVKIFGEPKVIQFISELIKDTTGFLYRNMTTEGKIQSIPRKKEAIESVIKLREKLHEAGIEVNHLDESLKQSAILIADELNCLLAGEPKVKLNGEILQAGNYNKQKLLEGSKIYLLEGAKDSTEKEEQPPDISLEDN